MKEKETARLDAEAAAREEMHKHSTEKEMARLDAEAAAQKAMKDRMMAKMNGFNYPSEEGLSPKKR